MDRVRGMGAGRVGVVLLLVGAALGGTAVAGAGQDGDSVGPGPETVLTREEATADLGQLLDFLERTHPDAYGEVSKLELQRRVHRAVWDLPEEGITVAELHSLAQPLLAAVGDGHTQVLPMRQVEGGDGPGLAVDWKILAAGPTEAALSLWVQGAAGGSLPAGSRLESIEGVGMAELVRRERGWEGYENEFGNLQNLVWRLQTEKGIRELVPEWAGGDSVQVTVTAPGGETVSARVVLGPSPATWDGEVASTAVELPGTQAGEPAYGFLDEGSTVVLRLDNTWAHREVFEGLTKRGSGNLSWAQSFYRRIHGEEAPADTAAVVAGLPGATDRFAELVEEMRAAGTERLVVDLRRNSGGSSMMVNLLLYYLYGREAWSEFFGHFYTIRRLTEADISSADSSVAGRFPYRVGDYDFSSEFLAGTRTASEAGSEGYWMASTISFARELESNAYEGYYVPPSVTVVVAPRTFSGGFWVAAALRRMGARVVGVSPGQAGNAFAHVQYATLENSGIRVGVSSRRFVLFPDDLEGMSTLPTDAPLTYEAWRATGFDPNAAVLLALDRVPAASAAAPR